MTIPESKPRSLPNSQTFFPTIQGIRVDLASIAALRHRCRPDHCDSGVFCCAYYEVGVSSSEMETIVGAMPFAAKHAAHLRTRDGYRNVFDETDSDLLMIDTDDRDLCRFAYRTERGTLCSLHSAALNLDRKPVDIKPKACSLWPLAIADTQPLTLTVQDDAGRFTCNRFVEAPSRRLDAGIAEILEMVFGKEFLEQVRAALSMISSFPRPK